MLNIKYLSAFKLDAIELIEKEMNVEYVIDSEVYIGEGYSDIPLAIFYAEKSKHPEFLNEYIAAYFTSINSKASMMELSKEQIEELKFDFVKSAEGELIYSKMAENCSVSKDNTVYICGGRQNTITNSADLVTFSISQGKLVETKPEGYIDEAKNQTQQTIRREDED